MIKFLGKNTNIVFIFCHKFKCYKKMSGIQKKNKFWLRFKIHFMFAILFAADVICCWCRRNDEH